MRPAAVWLCLVSAGAIAGCGKDTGGAAAPRPVTVEPPASTPAAETGEATETGEEPGEPRLELTAEFHRTRFGLGSGLWVLGIVHNPHAQRVTDVRTVVILVDGEGEPVGRAEGRIRRTLAPGERAPAAVLVPDPVPHEQLRLLATAIPDPAPDPAPLPLKLEHEPPQRAEFGGWYIVGQVQNTGSSPIEGARIEVQGLDRAGTLLGIDWLALDPIDPGETIEFDVGELRYEEPPSHFVVELRGPPPD